MTQQKILVTGGSSMVGKHLQAILPEATYVTSADADLTNQAAVDSLINRTKPTTVIHLAARVGGILDNIAHPGEYFY